MKQIVNAVTSALENAGLVQVEVSARHVHLCKAHVQALFGEGANLTSARSLSQPGQFLSKERITLVGPKSKKTNTAVLGPVRPDTQVELSKSDCISLGITAPLRESGDIKDSGSVVLEGPAGKIEIKSGVIIAHNHIHLTPETAEKLKLHDKQHVKVQVLTQRPIIFSDVIIRVNENFCNSMHIDFDEANAALVDGFTLGKIIP